MLAPACAKGLGTSAPAALARGAAEEISEVVGSGEAHQAKPGEWYLDRASGILNYMAADGENPNQCQFIAPKVEQLVLIAGRKDAPVRNIRIEEITLKYAEWALPKTGYSGIQAGHYGTNISQPPSRL